MQGIVHLATVPNSPDWNSSTSRGQGSIIIQLYLQLKIMSIRVVLKKASYPGLSEPTNLKKTWWKEALVKISAYSVTTGASMIRKKTKYRKRVWKQISHDRFRWIPQVEIHHSANGCPAPWGEVAVNEWVDSNVWNSYW